MPVIQSSSILAISSGMSLYLAWSNIARTEERDRGHIPILNCLSSQMIGVTSTEVHWPELVTKAATKILARQIGCLNVRKYI